MAAHSHGAIKLVRADLCTFDLSVAESFERVGLTEVAVDLSFGGSDAMSTDLRDNGPFPIARLKGGSRNVRYVLK